MPSKQAMDAAEEIQRRHVGWPEDSPQYMETVEKIAAIIDAAFAPVVAVLREAREELFTLGQDTAICAERSCSDGVQQADGRAYEIHAKIDALIGKEES